MQNLKEKLLSEKSVQDLKKVDNLPSKWHSHKTVYDHVIETIKEIEKNYSNSTIYLICACLHDIGKALTRTVNKNWFVTFPGHADVSKNLSIPILSDLVKEGYINSKEMEDCLFIIEHHMRPQVGIPWTKKSIHKFVKKMGNKLAILLRFTDIDIKGSNPDRIPMEGWVKEIALIYKAIEEYGEV